MFAWLAGVVVECFLFYKLRKCANMWLLAFLGFLLAFDLGMLAAMQCEHLACWFYYWTGRSVGIIFQSFVFHSLFKKEDTISRWWSASVVVLVAAFVGSFWLHPMQLTDHKMVFMSGIAAVANSILGIASWISSKRHLLCLGTLLWPLSCLGTLFNVQLYPYVVLLPLSIWLGHSFLSRQGEGTKTEENSPSKSANSAPGGYLVVRTH